MFLLGLSRTMPHAAVRVPRPAGSSYTSLRRGQSHYATEEVMSVEARHRNGLVIACDFDLRLASLHKMGRAMCSA